MGKIKSVKRTFLWYLSLCVAVAYLGAYGIGMAANEIQSWLEIKYSDVNYRTQLKEAYVEPEQLHADGDLKNTDDYVRIQFVKTANGMVYYDVDTIGKLFSDNPWFKFIYGAVSYGQGFLMVGWVLICVMVTGIIFYKRELEPPINVLMDASEKISENCLEFEMKPVKQNELGQLCRSFEDMRRALYENNRELWHTLEERKRLNAAFSHDIRTPLSVLRGYQEMLRNYVPEGRFSEEELMEMIETMGRQIERLENYAGKMSVVQKLEDIVPVRSAVKIAELARQCRETGTLLAGELEFELQVEQKCGDSGTTAEAVPAGEIFMDRELFLEVFENLVSNGVRFAKSRLCLMMRLVETVFELIAEDDGPGFSEEALHRGTDPFYGSEKDGRVHFGLGLYICKAICEKHGGELILENRIPGETVSGSKVTARFDVKKQGMTAKQKVLESR